MKQKALWLLVGAVLIGTMFSLSGCFFTKQEMVIDESGRADISVEFWFQEIMAGDEGAVGMQELLYLFPQLQDYPLQKRSEDSHIVYRFAMEDVDLEDNQYIDFTRRSDGSYLLQIDFPAVLEEADEESDTKVMIIQASLPKAVDMANTQEYSGNIVEWTLRESDFASPTTLKAFTVAEE